MSRVFTVNFTFREQPFSALVSLRKNGYDLSFIVRYLNHEAASILPQRKVIFSLVKGIEEPVQLPNKLSEDLVEKTGEAIYSYLQIRS